MIIKNKNLSTKNIKSNKSSINILNKISKTNNHEKHTFPAISVNSNYNKINNKDKFNILISKIINKSNFKIKEITNINKRDYYFNKKIFNNEI